MNFPKATNIDQQINLYVIKTQKFKTISISVFIHRPLNKEEATKNALIPFVLRRGTQKLNTSQDISAYLEDLYGAVFDWDVIKKGERQIIKFYLETINSPYFEKEATFEKTLEFVSQMILHPYIENEVFKADYVEQEKSTLKRIIKSKINNKSEYSLERCIQEMCKDEAYSIYQYGNVGDIRNINSNMFFDHYEHIIKSSPIDIFIVGDIDEKFAEQKVKDCFDFPRDSIDEIPETQIIRHVNEINKVEENLDVSQGVLCLGFRTNIPYNTEDYYPLVLYSNILVGGVSSKLFINVREKQSLVYSISSKLDKFKGLMFIQAGIDFDKYQKALDIILEQVQEMNNGNISDYEYNSSVKRINTSINSLQDIHSYIVDFFLSQIICESNYSFGDLLQRINSVKKEEISQISDNIKLDTIYFLKNNQK